ncbi:MAG TPA: PPC domain-containing protein [Polyangiales bacterium]|nr:PPC domain-containing protein [Polyangiales bacterium]
MPVDTTGIGVLQEVRSASQVDYFSFEAEAGSFYELATSRSRRFSPDNVMTLLDSELQPIAENDDGSLWDGDSIDARLVVRIAQGGKYFVRVQDPYTPPEVFDNPSFPLLYYHFWVRELLPNGRGVTHESSSQVRFAHDDRSGYDYTTLIGELPSAATDSFKLAGLREHALIAEVLDSGLRGGQVRVLDRSRHVLAEIDRSRGQHSIHPPLQDQTYELNFTADTDSGDNAFYAVNLVLMPDNPREHDDAGNDMLRGAEPLEMVGEVQRRGLLLTTLPEHDVDYFTFDVAAGEQVTLACEAQSGGSGVRGLHVEVRNAADQSLASAFEELDSNVLLDGFIAEQDGPLWLRLNNVASDASEILPWTRCVVLAGP